MALNLVGASTQYINKATPAFTVYPFTVGCWVRPTTTSAFGFIWVLGLDFTNYFALLQWNSDVFNAQCTVAGVDKDCLAGTITSGSWVFLVARFISATNRRLAVINATGVASHQQNTASGTFTPTSERIGALVDASLPFTGQIGEFWTANVDIQPDGAQLQDHVLRQLAYGGPFSVPHVAKDIVEYRSFRKHPIGDELGEVYYGSKKQVWTATNTPTIGLHPPTPYWFVRPDQTQRLLTVL